MEANNSNKCLRCGGSLRLIGKERKNGKVIANKTGKDWATRKYHKKCWKEIQERERIKAELQTLYK